MSRRPVGRDRGTLLGLRLPEPVAGAHADRVGPGRRVPLVDPLTPRVDVEAGSEPGLLPGSAVDADLDGVDPAGRGPGDAAPAGAPSRGRNASSR